MPDLNRPALEDQRRALVHYLETRRPQGSSRNRVTVVFDGSANVIGSSEAAFVEVVFSRNESADEKIQRMVESSSRKKDIVVVTNDRAIQYAVRAVGARVIGVAEFLAKSQPAGRSIVEGKRSSTRKSKGQSSKDISKVIEFKINDEMSKIWLEGRKRKNR